MNNLQWLLEQQAAMIADLQNQQATAATQNSAPTPAPIPAPALVLSPLKVYIIKPSDFNSNDYDIFKQVIGFYLLAAHQDFAIKQDQILFVLLYIKREHAGTQAQNYQANFIDWEYQTFAHLFNEFIDKLDKAFIDSNWAANAQCKLSNL